MAARPELLDAMVRCAGCHDQCMTATAEAAASGNQVRLVSRVATLGLQLADGRMPWTDEAAESLFYGMDDEAQVDYCIYAADGHRIRPYLRELRREAIEHGHAPAFVRRAADAIAEHGNVFGIPVPGPGPRSCDVVLLHDAATAALAPAAPEAARVLLNRSGIPADDVWIPSGGVIEADLGLEHEAEAARVTALEAVTQVPTRLVVSSDPVLVASLRSVVAGMPSAPAVLHVAEVLLDASVRFRTTGATVAVHDDGASGRSLGLAGPIRALLARVPGVEVLEPVNRGRAASSDGPRAVYPDPELARRIAGRRMEELALTGAGMVLTSSPYSLANLRAVDHGTQVEDLAVFLASLAEP